MKSMHVVRDLPTVARMAGELVYLSVMFDRAPLDGLMARMTPTGRRYARRWTDAERIRRLSEMVVYQLPYLNMGNCLKLSLLRFLHLTGRGFNVRFHMGVKPDRNGVTGHAWLTLNGEPLWEDAEFLGGFRETWAYPPPEGDAGKRNAQSPTG